MGKGNIFKVIASQGKRCELIYWGCEGALEPDCQDVALPTCVPTEERLSGRGLQEGQRPVLGGRHPADARKAGFLSLQGGVSFALTSVSDCLFRRGPPCHKALLKVGSEAGVSLMSSPSRKQKQEGIRTCGV